jgi:hypothetical protein
MSSFTNLFYLKNAPNKPSVKNQVALFTGAELFNLSTGREAFCQTLLDTIYRLRIQKVIIRFEIAPSSLLNHTVGWND